MAKVGRPPICARCHKKIESAQYKTHKGKKYHYECFMEIAEEEKAVEQAKKKAFSDPVYDKLIDYIVELYRQTDTKGWLEKTAKEQVKRMVEQNGYSYQGMMNTLKYVHEILHKPVYERLSIGLVPYYYENAQKFFKNIAEANKGNAMKDSKGVVVVAKIVTPDCKMKMIDIEDL